MQDQQPEIERMQDLIFQWQEASDQREIFLSCYHLMTGNTLQAIDEGEFNDNQWVEELLGRFAGYYFDALDQYQRDDATTPAVWVLAFDAARDPDIQVLQNLIMGVNAHINYDLVLTLVDMLDPEWERLSEIERNLRYADHRHVNDIIGRTVDTVQDTVIEPRSPAMDIVDKVLGPIDEWVASRMIAHWRDEVWDRAVNMLETADPDERENLRLQTETTALKRAGAILFEEGPAGLRHMF